MTVEQETLWLRAWERGARGYGWNIVRRIYRPDEGTMEEYGFYCYLMNRDGQERTVQIGTLMMEKFAVSESLVFELDPEWVSWFGVGRGEQSGI